MLMTKERELKDAVREGRDRVSNSEPQASGFTANNKEKLRAELVLFSVEKACALHLTSFLLSVLL